MSKCTNYIDRISVNRREVPVSLWQIIKNNINYSEFKTMTIQILLDIYTLEELESLLIKYSDQSFIPIEYIVLRNRLYEVQERFNSVIIGQINAILVSNNYSQIID